MDLNTFTTQIKMAFKVKKSKLKEKDFETRTYKVYSFEKAPKEVQEKALEKYRDFNVENDGWYEDDFLLDMSVPKKVSDNSFRVKEGNTIYKWDKLYFDLDRSDYLQFVGLKVEDDDSFRQSLGISNKTWGKVHYSFVNDRENNTKIEFHNNYEVDGLSEKENEEIEKAEELFSEQVHQAKKRLKENYEYNTSDEAVKDSLIANDYRFNEKGEID